MQETVQSLQLPRVGLTHGDLNGVGYELIIKAFDDARMLGMMTPVLYGQSKAFSYYKKNFGLDSFNYSLTRDARQAWGQKFNIVNIVDKELKIDPGMVTEVSTEMDIMSMKRASEDLRVGYLDAVVMAPSSPSLCQTHKEFLSSLFQAADTMQVLVSGMMKLALLTDAMPLQKALALLTKDYVAGKLVLLASAIKKDFMLASPKMAVLGIDPEGFPEGSNHVVDEAIGSVKEKGIMAFGPFTSTQFFATGMWKKYDVVLAMTHEQGTLPFRLLSDDSCAYYWAGLPAVVTAPLQGPEFELANLNQATPDAYRAALYLALDIVNAHRENYFLN